MKWDEEVLTVSRADARTDHVTIPQNYVKEDVEPGSYKITWRWNAPLIFRHFIFIWQEEVPIRKSFCCYIIFSHLHKSSKEMSSKRNKKTSSSTRTHDCPWKKGGGVDLRIAIVKLRYRFITLLLCWRCEGEPNVVRTTHLQAHADEIGEREPRQRASDPAIHKRLLKLLLLFFLFPSSGNSHLRVHNFLQEGKQFAFLVSWAKKLFVLLQLREYYVTTSSFREVIDVLVVAALGSLFLCFPSCFFISARGSRFLCDSSKHVTFSSYIWITNGWRKCKQNIKLRT